jgi:DNA modification methylase
MSRVINKEIEQVAIDLLKHHPRNANNGDVEAIKTSLAVNGWYGSVVVNTGTKHILAGNHRVMAAKALGWETVPVQWVDVTPEEELRILVVDNRTTRIGQDDTTKITDILAELANTPIGLDGTGYGAADLDALIDELAGITEPAELLTDPDEVPEEVETRCQPGDLWILGRHRLLCGDSTKADDVARLMDGNIADMVFTDPPYGMFLNTDYDSMFANDDAHRKTGKRFSEVVGDHQDFSSDLINTIFAMFSDTKEIFIWGADYFSELIQNRKDGSWIVWDKRTNENMDKVSGNTFELCWSKQKHKRLIARILWSGHHGMAKDDTKKRVHPTQKPVELAMWFFEQWGKNANHIVDLYLGSGTTLIASEKTNRKCYGLELDPKYCDVVIQRWENATGQKAVLSEG